MRSYYAGAAQNRLTSSDWSWGNHSPDFEAKSDLRVLRSRSRVLYRDNPYIRGWVATMQSNVLGWQGMRFQARHTTTRGDQHQTANAALAAAWADFSKPENAGVTGRLSINDIARLSLSTILVDGEMFIRKVKGFNNGHGFALQLIDPDLLDELYNRNANEGANEIRMGVEIDDYGRAIAYHMWEKHPYEFQARNNRIRIPAEELLHLFFNHRVGQTRGIPMLAVALRDMKTLDGYQEAELVAARTAAAKMGFFEVDPEKGGAYTLPSEPSASDQEQSISMDASPGALEQLPPGMTFKSWDPQHPAGSFGPFVKAILRAMAVGLGVPYHTFAGDLEGVNYSSAREGKIEALPLYRALQEWMKTFFYRPIYEAWLPMAMLSGAIALPSFDPARWSDVDWLPRGWDWVDPLKDIQAASLEIAMGLTSRTTLCAERGVDFEAVLQDLQREKQLAEQYGIVLSLDTKLTAVPDAGGGTATPADEVATPQGGDRALHVVRAMPAISGSRS